MSQLKTNAIRHTTATSDAITLASDGTATAKITNNLSNRNVFINGAAQINQRGSATGITSSSTKNWNADRWVFDLTSAGTYTVSTETSSPPAGFSHYLKAVCTSVATPGATSIAQIIYEAEGQDLIRFKKGTSSATKMAISFWIKAKVAGTYVIELFDTDNSRNIHKQYTISSAETWEHKEVIFDGDTSTGDPFTYDNNHSLSVMFKLQAGSNWNSGTAHTVWTDHDSDADRAVGQVNAFATNNDYIQMTGLQLEASDNCTDFEYRSYGDELLRCWRYYYLWMDGNAQATSDNASALFNTLYFTHHFPVKMRIAPALDITSGTNWWTVYTSGTNGSVDTFGRDGITSYTVGAFSKAFTASASPALIRSANSGCRIAWDAEL